MGLPAATFGSYHTCPAYDGDDPHVGGPVISGSSNVFLGGKMICCVGDKLQCNSPSPDSIAAGSTSVFVNGKGIARMGDATAHGGTITEGSNSIFVG
jgi:uncharacterized Zn-binding protein involved in type VI secretion